MALATLDILDKEFSRTSEDFLKQDPITRFRVFTEGFMLDRNYWDRYHKELASIPFKWEEFKYSEIKDTSDLDKVINSDETGVYMFLVKADNLIYDLPKFIFYVGIAGEGSSSRPLKERLKDYFKLSQIKKRKKVHRMLSMYYKNVYVAFSVLKKSRTINLEKIEEDLHGFFYPICNDRDFPVEIKETRKAF